MSIHELMINSIKYSALKFSTGQVFLSVVRHVETDTNRDHFIRLEIGGTPPPIPTLRGFEHRMIESAILSGGGNIKFNWNAKELICEFELVTKRYR